MLKSWTHGLLLFSAVCLVGCATHHRDGPPGHRVDVSKIPDARPRPLPRSRYGNPRTYRVFGKTYHVLGSSKNYRVRGIASWYGRKFHGRLTSTRERYNMYAMTAASPVLPLPCFVRVTNLKNGRSVVVKVNDRGPFAHNRIMDLSYVAAKKLGYARQGTALVEVSSLNLGRPQTKRRPIIYLQIGAYPSLNEARAVVRKIHRNLPHINGVIEQANVRGKTWFRVQLGPIHGVTASDRLYRKAQGLGYTGAMTVIR